MRKKILKIITTNAKETQKAGKFLAEELFRNILIRKKALVIGLKGELGSGKTTFIQGLAQGLGIKEKITSPTFVLLKKFNFFYPKKQKNIFFHIDCYRLDNSKNLIDLDFREILKQRRTVIIIEWAEKVEKILPPDTLWIKFEYLNKNQRKIIL